MKIPERAYLARPTPVTAPLGDLIPAEGDSFTRAVQGVYLYNKYRPQDALSLAELRAQEANGQDLQCLDDLPRLSADGLTRTHIHYLPPAGFSKICAARGWEQTEGGQPIADVVVIGAGPGGLATSYHLAQSGARVVTLESGYAAQAFSDAGAASVHSMRTDRLLTSLIRTGRALEDLTTVMGLPAGLGVIVAHAARARDQLWDRTGHQIKGLPENIQSTDRYQPAARAELFEHFQEVADYLGQECPNSFLLERAPVQRIQKNGEFFEIETAPGHRLRARKLVMATGLVQEGGSNARSLPVLHDLAERYPDRYLVLENDRDLVEQAAALASGDRQCILTDRLLGRPEVKLTLHRLPAQARVAVVGSGESAVKAALEVLSQNPTLKVDLFTKAPLEAAQVQVPGENFHPVVLERGPTDRDYGKLSLARFAEFDTPVTPRSLVDALDEVAAGRLRIHEMGAYFDSSSIRIEPDGQGRSTISFQDPQVVERLEQQRLHWQQQGLTQPAIGEVTDVAMVIQAAGYQRSALPLHPLARQLQEQNLIQIDQGQIRLDGLVSAASPDVGLCSAMALGTAADSAIPGMAVRGRQLAEHFHAQLPDRPRPPQAEKLDNPGADWAHGYSDQDFHGFVRYRGLAPNWVDSQGGAQDTPQFHFPDPERYLRELDQKDPQSLRPAEKIALERAHRLRLRMGSPDF